MKKTQKVFSSFLLIITRHYKILQDITTRHYKTLQDITTRHYKTLQDITTRHYYKTLQDNLITTNLLDQ
jgi:hypothetical protein